MEKKIITPELLDQFQERYAGEKTAHTLHAATARTELADLAYVPSQAARLNGAFEIELKTRGITAQEKSGRCWMFAAMNILRETAAEKCGLEEFTLSGNYLAFYDKLEKANNFLNLVVENAGKPLSDRMSEYILKGIGDGGYWDMAVDLVRKYGVVPASVMPETYQSNHTEKFRRLTNTLLRKDAAELRERIAAGEDVRERMEEMLWEIYRAQCIVYGEPPRTFDFEYRVKDGEYHADRGLTPKAFYEKYIGTVLDDYVVVTDHPTPERESGRLYTFHYMGSMTEGNVTALNLTIDDLEALCLKQMRDGEPVWFGCDSGAYGDRKKGVWDPASLDYEGLLGGVALRDTKSNRLRYRDSYASHAMILTGVGFDADGRPSRWKIENSWGKDVGEKGYFVCSEAYFREYVYEAVIHKKHFNEEQLAMLDQSPVVIQPWETY